MKKIIEIPQTKIDDMKAFYDLIDAGICIQKFVETEDGKGDFIPIYANQAFAACMGIPLDFLYKFSLRQASQEFPEQKLAELVDIAFNGRVVIGDSFSKDFSQYFNVKISQYAYGYTITFMTNVTTSRINGNTLVSVSNSFEAIYYARLNEIVCTRVYPVSDVPIEGKAYEDIVKDIIVENNVSDDDCLNIESFLNKGNIRRALALDNSVTMRFQSVNEKRNHRWCQIEVIANERDAMGPAALVIAIKDINDLVREEKKKQQELAAAYEKVKKANESKNIFLAHMSHDIRTPINGILGMLQVLENQDTSEETRRDYRQKIKMSAESLLSLFTDILDITKLDTEDIDFNMTELDLNNVKTQFELYKNRSQINMILSLPELKHPYRFGCEEYLRQIVLKLISNADKFNKDNNPIEVGMCEIEDSNRIMLTVKDHGIGISEEFKAHVFEPFSQEKSDGRTHYEGSGVGLTYVKKIVDALGGTISFDSKVGEGTTFIVEVPLEIDYEKEKRNSVDAHIIELAGKKALVVEDNEINALIVECFLDKEKMNYDRAMNGQLALDRFLYSKEDEYDLILMDVMMPVMNGLEATKAIRGSNHPRAKTIPIIGISANYFPEDIKRGKNAGMNYYISKPINSRQLVEAIAMSVNNG